MLRGFAAVDARKYRREADEKIAGADEHPAHWVTDGQSSGHWRDCGSSAIGADRNAREAGSGRGRNVLAAGSGLTDAGLLLQADAAEQRASDIHRGATGDFRPGFGSDDLSHATRSGRTGKQYNVWIGGQRLEREHQCRPARGSSTEGWGCLG